MRLNKFVVFIILFFYCYYSCFTVRRDCRYKKLLFPSFFLERLRIIKVNNRANRLTV